MSMITGYIRLYLIVMKHLLTLLISFCLFITAHAQESPFSWIIGAWEGPGFDGRFEEVWAEPDENGQLMGMFRYTDKAGAVQFYEFWILSEDGMKLRHFNPDFTAWEEKDEWVTFEMKEYDDRNIYMKGLSYEQMGEDQMKISLTLKEGDNIQTHVFNLTRINK